MDFKYGIISLPRSDRDTYKAAIRQNVPYAELHLDAFNAHEHDPLEALDERGLFLNGWGNAKRGELGVWISNYDRWKQASEEGPLIVFEDDAIVGEDFQQRFEILMAEVPDDWDFVSLWVPGNQLADYLYDVDYNEDGIPHFNGYVKESESRYRIGSNHAMSLVYQGYGMVSLVYSPKGASRLVELAHDVGLSGPVDCWTYQQAHRGALKGFAPLPHMTGVVSYDWSAESHVQNTERV